MYVCMYVCMCLKQYEPLSLEIKHFDLPELLCCHTNFLSAFVPRAFVATVNNFCFYRF